MKFLKRRKDLFINVFLEFFEFSIGLLILNKINNITNQNIDILKSLDFLITSLVYLVISIKSMILLLDPRKKEPSTSFMYTFYTLVMVLGVVFTTLDIISFKSGGIVNFNTNYALIGIAIMTKGAEKTEQNIKIKLFEEVFQKAQEWRTQIKE